MKRRIRQFFKRMFCPHLSWAPNIRRLYQASTNDNHWVCKACGKAKNFGWRSSGGWVAFPNDPVNYDGTGRTDLVGPRASVLRDPNKTYRPSPPESRDRE